MAHTRKRQIQPLFDRLVQFSPILGVFGHRQVGKTTLASAWAKKYWTLDDRATRELVAKNPKAFLTRQKLFPTILDECQLEPDLFPALKERVRVHKNPGQFVLTGSVRFTSRKAIRESLAGRMVTLELLPLVISELEQKPLPEILSVLLKASTFQKSILSEIPCDQGGCRPDKAFEKYLSNGGLPGLCFIRDERLRREALGALHQLILDRDLRLVVATRLSMNTLNQFLRWIATHAWLPYNAAEVKRQFGLSHVTQQSLLYALESIFLIRRIPLASKKGVIFLLEDQFEERALSEKNLSKKDQILSAFYRNVRAQFQYRLGSNVQYESYWTRNNAHVPLVIHDENKSLGFSVVDSLDSRPSLSQTRSADSFLRHYPQAKIIYLLPPGEGSTASILDERSLLCPVSAMV